MHVLQIAENHSTSYVVIPTYCTDKLAVIYPEIVSAKQMANNVDQAVEYIVCDILQATITVTEQTTTTLSSCIHYTKYPHNRFPVSRI